MTSYSPLVAAAALLVLAAASSALHFSFDRHQEAELSVDEVWELFGSWKELNEKFYRTIEEDQKRFKTFHQNIKKIISLNKVYKDRDLKFAPNKFADLSESEFRTKVLMPKRGAPKFPKDKYLTGTYDAPLPTSFNWTDKGMVTNVKNQGFAGTCWAFSAVANVEGQWAMKGKNLSSFSVEQIVDCDGNEDVQKGHADCGVFGGWPYLSYQFMKKMGGLELESDYTYCAGGGGKPGTCFVCSPPGFNKTLCGPPIPWCNITCFDRLDKTKFVSGLNVTDWKAIDQNETVMAHQLMQVGPLSVALNAQMLQFYSSGVFDPILCDPKTLDHAVLVTGFGVYKGWFSTKPYWVVKNSWGADWGINGYFWVKRGAGTCGINTSVTTAILK